MHVGLFWEMPYDREELFVCCTEILIKHNSPAAETVGELCLDIEIYLEVLEAVHAAGFGDGVQVIFRVLNRHCEASKQLVIT